MSSKKFRRGLLAVSLLTLTSLASIGLSSCSNEQQQVDDDQNNDQKSNVLTGVTGFSISNKESLTASWRAGDGNRMLQFTFEGNSDVNPVQALNDGAIEIVSSDTSIITNSGLYLISHKEGSAGIMVTVHTDKGDLHELITFDILEGFVQPKPTATTVSKLIDMDFDKWSNTKPQPLYEVKGIVTNWYGSTGSGYGIVDNPSSYGNFYIKDPDTGEEILVYGASKKADNLKFNSDGTWTFTNKGDFLGDDGKTPAADIGKLVTLNVILAEYNGTIQLNAVITNVENPVINYYESATLTVAKTTLKLGEQTTYTAKGAPDNATDGAVEVVVVPKEEDKGKVELKNGKIFARKEGTVTLVAQAGSEGHQVKSEPVTITIEGTEIARTPVKDVYSIGTGKEVYFSAKYIGDYKGDENYGIFVGDGESAIFIYHGEAPSGVKKNDVLDIYGVVGIHNGGFQVTNADIQECENVEHAGIADPVAIDVNALDNLAGLDGHDTGREISVKGRASDISVDNYGTYTFMVTTDKGIKVKVEADNRYVDWKVLNQLQFLKSGDTIALDGNVTFKESGAKEIPQDSTFMVIGNPQITEGAEIEYTSIAKAYEAEAGDYINFYGKYMGQFKGEQNYGMYVGDGETAILVYKANAPKGVEIGDDILVNGVADVHNGLFQAASGAVVTKGVFGETTAQETVGVDFTTLADLSTINGNDASRAATITGKVSNYDVDNYGTFTFTVTTEKGVAVNVEADNRYIPLAELNKFSFIANDQTVSLTGNISFDDENAEGVPQDSTGLVLVNPRITSEVTYQYTNIEEVYKTSKGKFVNFYGKYMGAYGSNGIFVGDGERAVFVYKGKVEEGVNVGDVVTVSGQVDIFNGGFQVKNSVITKAEDGKYTPADPVEINLTSLEGIDGYDTGRAVTLAGKVTEIKSATNTIDFEVEIAKDVVVALRADKRYMSSGQFEAIQALQKDSEVKIKGYIGFYDSGSSKIPADASKLQIVNPSLVTE